MDFTILEELLKNRKLPVEQILNDNNRALISNMEMLYDMKIDDVHDALIWSLTNEDFLDIEEFQLACHNFYKAKGNDVIADLKRLIKPISDEERLIQRFETISPKQLLEDLSGGNQASKQDLKAIQDVMLSQGLPTPVMNVLVNFVLLQTNMKLSKGYLEKVASHWSRAGLKTAKEAMVFAKKEKKNHQKSQNQHVKGKQKTKLASINSPIPASCESEKPFTVFEYKYMENLFDRYKMNFDISREIILYGRKVNHSLMVYWFLDAVSEYVYRHKSSAASENDTRELLNKFHDKFVVNFGKEEDYVLIIV